MKPMTDQQKLNPVGAHLLSHYYTTHDSRKTDGADKKVKYPIYNLNSAKDIPLLMNCAAKEGLTTYGIVVVTGGRHRTPLMIDNNEAYIFESLGTSKSKVGINSVAQIGIAIKKANLNINNIYSFKDARQVDSCSCGSDSFIALKQAFNMKDNLGEFVKNETKEMLTLNQQRIIDKNETADPFFSADVNIIQLKNLPPDVAKYAQSTTTIQNYDYKSAPISSSSDVKNKEPETMREYTLRHQKISTIPLEGTHEIAGQALKARKMITVNAALEQRRNKHARVLTELAKKSSPNQIKEIIKESSGINLISKHLQELSESLLGMPHTKVEDISSLSQEELIEQYIVDEIAKKCDEKTGMAPEGMSLTELAEQLATLPSASIQNAPGK